MINHTPFGPWMGDVDDPTRNRFQEDTAGRKPIYEQPATEDGRPCVVFAAIVTGDPCNSDMRLSEMKR